MKASQQIIDFCPTCGRSHEPIPLPKNPLVEQCRAKDKWISKLLEACEYLAREYEKNKELPAFVVAAMEDQCSKS